MHRQPGNRLTLFVCQRQSRVAGAIDVEFGAVVTLLIKQGQRRFAAGCDAKAHTRYTIVGIIERHARLIVVGDRKTGKLTALTPEERKSVAPRRIAAELDAFGAIFIIKGYGRRAFAADPKFRAVTAAGVVQFDIRNPARGDLDHAAL